MSVNDNTLSCIIVGNSNLCTIYAYCHPGTVVRIAMTSYMHAIPAVRKFTKGINIAILRQDIVELEGEKCVLISKEM